MPLTQERLKEIYAYTSETGVFIRRVSVGGNRAGEQAGSIASNGYRIIGIDGHYFRAHRLAWLYAHGVMPDGQIDHINGCRADNRIMNLRVVTHAENQHNVWHPKANSTTGLQGVSRCARSGKWRAGIVVSNRKIWIGRFDTPELAHAAYIQAKAEMHPSALIAIKHRQESLGPPTLY